MGGVIFKKGENYASKNERITNKRKTIRETRNVRGKLAFKLGVTCNNTKNRNQRRNRSNTCTKDFKIKK